MSVKGKRKKPKAEKTTYKPKRPKKSLKQYLMIGFVMLATIAFIFSSLPQGTLSSRSTTSTPTTTTTAATTTTTAAPPSEPQFTEEGSLDFVRGADGTPIRSIKIEIADDNTQRAKGMMHRKSIPNDTGMLFIMDQLKEQSFYMRNTYVSLDIIYIDDAFNIVSIAKNTVPLTETSIPSNGPAKYVLEVAAGYTDAYDIKPGDKIAFERN